MWTFSCHESFIDSMAVEASLLMNFISQMPINRYIRCMNPRKMRVIGILGGMIVTVLSAMVFYRSIQADTPNWKMLIMSCGMAFFLFYLAFSSRSNHKKSK